MTTPPRPSLEERARIWIQTEYPEESKLVGSVKNPERERDYVSGARSELEALRGKFVKVSNDLQEMNFKIERELVNSLIEEIDEALK